MLKGWVLLSTHPVRSFNYLELRRIEISVRMDPRSVVLDLRLNHEIFDDSSAINARGSDATPLRRLDRGL